MKITALLFRGMAIGLLSAAALAGCQKEAAVNGDLTAGGGRVAPGVFVIGRSLFVASDFVDVLSWSR